MSSSHRTRQRAGISFSALLLVAAAPSAAHAQVPVTGSAAASAKTAVSTPVASTPALRATRSTSAAAWALPDPDVLIERVFARIVTQDKPNAIPVRDYTQRLLGREETLAAVKQFAGYPVELRPSAFAAVSDWTEARRADFKPCFGESCEAPVNSLWLAVTRIERGELPHEVHVWYTTSFASAGPTGPAKHSYAFCERWLRVNGTWKYDGFVRVNSGS